MEHVILYIHGQGGSPEEAAHYRSLFGGRRVIGLDYTAQTPWEAREEFPALFDAACQGCSSVEVVANSIGAYFTMCAWQKNTSKKPILSLPSWIWKS